MQEKYSNGFYSEVYRVSPEQKLWFPRSDLVRLDSSSDKNWFARLFYRHKIASLLFPNNFIEVVGAQVDPWERNFIYELQIGDTTVKGLRDREHRLFSKMADVPGEHSKFSSHISLSSKGRKVSICKCGDCIAHKEFHSTNDLEEKARRISAHMMKIGIMPPFTDLSDYCLTKEGNIIFFEIGSFEEKKLEMHLSSLGEKRSENEETALRLLKRFNVLHEESRRIAFTSGVAGELRLN